METKTLYAGTKQLEARAKHFSAIIFEFHMESEIYDGYDVDEKLAIICEKIDILKERGKKDKKYALAVAKRLSWLVSDFIEENQLCADCYKSLHYKTVMKQTYSDSEVGVQYCKECGYEEAM